MFLAARTLQRFAWIALFAMLGVAFAPTVSAAVGAAREDVPWNPICTGEGMQNMALESRGDADGRSGHDLTHLFKHCPFCAMQPMAAALPSAPLQLPGAERLHEQPALFLSAPTPMYAWRHALSRGPPAFA
jgi:hypothetical protein